MLWIGCTACLLCCYLRSEEDDPPMPGAIEEVRLLILRDDVHARQLCVRSSCRITPMRRPRGRVALRSAPPTLFNPLPFLSSASQRARSIDRSVKRLAQLTAFGTIMPTRARTTTAHHRSPTPPTPPTPPRLEGLL